MQFKFSHRNEGLDVLYLEHKCNVEQTWSHTHTHTHTHRYDCRSPAESICIEFGK